MLRTINRQLSRSESIPKKRSFSLDNKFPFLRNPKSVPELPFKWNCKHISLSSTAQAIEIFFNFIIEPTDHEKSNKLNIFKVQSLLQQRSPTYKHKVKKRTCHQIKKADSSIQHMVPIIEEWRKWESHITRININSFNRINVKFELKLFMEKSIMYNFILNDRRFCSSLPHVIGNK